MADLKGIAVYGANRMGLFRELRHYIDIDTLKGLNGGKALFASIVPPVPKIRQMTGLGMESQRAVGMLPSPLYVEVHVDHGLPTECRMVLALQGVVVVDRLPVPLHVSIKQLEDRCGSQADNVLGCLYPALMNSDNMNTVPYAAASLPIEYGIDQHHKLMKQLTDSLPCDRNLISVLLVKCRKCGKRDGPMYKCSRCASICYCCSEHQRADWPRHKKSECCMSGT